MEKFIGLGLVFAAIIVVALIVYGIVALADRVGEAIEDRKYSKRSGWYKNPLDGMWHHEMPDL